MTSQSAVKPLSTPQSGEGGQRGDSSPVDRLLRFLQLYRAGQDLPSEAAAQGLFWLTHAQFGEFERRLRADRALWGWFDNQVRWNWEPSLPHWSTAKGRLQVLMPPGVVHELLVRKCDDALFAAIGALAKKLEGYGNPGDMKAAEELRRVLKGGSMTMKFPLVQAGAGAASTPRHSPDAAYYHPDQLDFPCLLLEVSDSQQFKHLRDLAESDIFYSEHAVRCVVGLDIEYQAPGRKRKVRHDEKPAALFVWRAGTERNDHGVKEGFCRLDVDAASIRSADGAGPQGALELTLRDLLPADTIKAASPQHPDEGIRIPFSDLADYLAAAESAELAVDAARAAGPAGVPISRNISSSPPARLRYREPSPPEEVHGETEHKLLRPQEADLESAKRQDRGSLLRTVIP